MPRQRLVRGVEASTANGRSLSFGQRGRVPPGRSSIAPGATVRQPAGGQTRHGRVDKPIPIAVNKGNAQPRK